MDCRSKVSFCRIGWSLPVAASFAGWLATSRKESSRKSAKLFAPWCVESSTPGQGRSRIFEPCQTKHWEVRRKHIADGPKGASKVAALRERKGHGRLDRAGASRGWSSMRYPLGMFLTAGTAVPPEKRCLRRRLCCRNPGCVTRHTGTTSPSASASVF